MNPTANSQLQIFLAGLTCLYKYNIKIKKEIDYRAKIKIHFYLNKNCVHTLEYTVESIYINKPNHIRFLKSLIEETISTLAKERPEFENYVFYLYECYQNQKKRILNNKVEDIYALANVDVDLSFLDFYIHHEIKKI
jgi:hypothetical protein